MKQCAGSGDAQVPSKILTAVALVCAQAFHRGGHLLAQVTESIVAANRQPERQNVDCHGRRLECRATYARHEWHRDDNIRLAEQSVEKRAVAGDQCLGPRCSRRVCHVFEAVEASAVMISRTWIVRSAGPVTCWPRPSNAGNGVRTSRQ